MYEIIQQVLTYLRSMWRYRWYAMGVAWLAASIGWAVVYTLPDEYTASARLHVDTESVLRPLMRGLTIEPDLTQRLKLMTRTLLSRPNMEKLIRMTDMDIRTTNAGQMDAMLARLSTQIQLQASARDANLYTIEYSSANPAQAKAIVQNLITILMESTLGQSRENSQTAQQFLQRQLEHYKVRLLEAEKKLQKFKQDNAELMPTLRDGYFQSLQATKKQLSEAQLLLEEATRRRNELRRQTLGEEPVFGLAQDPALSRGASDSILVQRIKNLQAQRDELLLQYTEKHPKVISIDETINSLREQLQAEEEAKRKLSGGEQMRSLPALETNPVFQQLRISLAQAEAEVSALSVRVKEYQKRVDELVQKVDLIPVIEGQLVHLQQEYDLNLEKYNEFRQRKETAELSEEVEDAGQALRVQVIDPPSVPPNPSGPNRLLFNSAVLVLSLGIGIALAFVLSQIKPVVHETKTLQQLTGLPVYGSVSRVWTPELLHKKRVEYGGFATVGVMLVSVYTSLMVFVG